MEPVDRYDYSPTHPPDGRPATYRVTVVTPTADELFELTSRYFETVWSAFLGPTTTLLARRLGLILAGPDLAPDLGVSCVSPGCQGPLGAQCSGPQALVKVER